MRLPGDLVAAHAGGDLAAVVDLQADFLAQVQLIVRVVALDGHRLAIDEAVELHGRSQLDDLLEDLLHLPMGERATVQAVDLTVVLEEDVRPVVQQVLFRRVFKDPAVVIPPVFLKIPDKGFLELFLCLENHLRAFLFIARGTFSSNRIDRPSSATPTGVAPGTAITPLAFYASSSSRSPVL